MPLTVLNDWDDAGLPASRLYEAEINSDSTACAAVGAHGMGGVRKTLSCLLVAHKIQNKQDW